MTKGKERFRKFISDFYSVKIKDPLGRLYFKLVYTDV